MATLFMASGNYSPGITDVDYDRWALDNHEPSEGYEPAEETDAGDDYPMSDEGCTADDITLMTRAAAVAWPGAILSTSSIMLSLSRLKAEEILKSPRKRG
jgi:hypothetical protein